MIGITNAGGGNLDQFGIRLLNEFPENPKEGDIVCYYGLDTPIGEITPWGISTDRVDESQDGYTFIHIDVVPQQFPVAFWASLHKRNPSLGLSCYWGPVLQKINGKYVYMKAVLRAGGEWKQISESYNGELFANGNQYTDVTGGWNPTGARMAPWNEGWGGYSPTMDIGTNMVVYQASNPHFGTIFTRNAINVTNYRTLKANVQYDLKGPGFNNGFWLGVTTSTGDQYSPLASFMAQTDSGNKSYDGVINIDISGVSGNVYVFIACVRHSHVSEFGTNPVTFRKIWLE